MDLRMGIDHYGLSCLGLTPLETLEWAEENHAEGVQFSGLSVKERIMIDDAYLKDLSLYAAEKDLYIEWGGAQHIPFDMESWDPKDVHSINKKAVQEASVLGTHVVRSCSGGLMRWEPKNPDTEFLLRATAETLTEQRSLFEDFGVTLAIETHFEFTTFELIRLFEMCDAEPGEYLGICLDTMNLLTMLEEPTRAVRRMLPWVVSTHVKDGGLILTSEGLISFPCEIGRGIIDFKTIIERLSSLTQEVNLSIEDHGGSFLIPVFDKEFLKGFPDLNLNEFIELMGLAEKTRGLMVQHGLTITERDKWSELCESRMRNNIKALKNILGYRRK
ncbi:MAG: TIM barrel protein [Candidatus Aminicenantes bacterium]|nr:TIM barrel protein [Candidatus Aminicenantes bacterium]